MVAIINTGRSIRAAFLYNENKLKEGVADLIMAQNYPMDLADMKEQHRLQMLLKTASKNENVTRNSVHISLNFAPGEHFSQDRLREITAEYMDEIGFGGQPYLVYQHHDAGHEHVHIVSVKVRPDGTRIDMQNIGKVQSENARKELERKYNLVRAEDHKHSLFKLQPVDAKKVMYGKTQTRRAIAGVLNHVLKTYKYTSLSELNAVLGLYNVAAERGEEGSRTFQHHGLYYRVLDEQGSKVGVPIKASLFHNKPTLKYIEDRYAVNDALRQPHKTRIKSAIDFAFHGKYATIADMVKELDKKGIDTIIRRNQDNRIYGMTYVDHQTKCVFNGSDIGKAYSANAIIERHQLNLQNKIRDSMIPGQQGANAKWEQQIQEFLIRNPGTSSNNPLFPSAAPAGFTGKQDDLLDILMQPEYTGEQLPYQLRKKRKKKKRNQSKNL